MIRVPTDVPTVADAVAKAQPGDVVVIAPGTYYEAVKVTVDGITIRGEDRNTVIFDGQDKLATGVSVEANGVAVENMTLHNYTQNGVLFNGAATAEDGADVAYGAGAAVLSGYRASYVTTYNNGLYGIYAFAARNGLIEHSFASGHPDSGIYVGQCQPCNVVLRDVTAERNAIGYYGTNASGGVYVIESVFRGNRLGITPNSQKMEKLAPQIETVVAGNLVVDNDDPNTPAIASGFFGGGIAIGGGTRNTVVRNRVEGNPMAGILLVSLNEFQPRDNRIEGNVLNDNGLDLFYSPTGTSETLGNCFAGNDFTSSWPESIEQVMSCDGTPTGLGGTPPSSAPDPPGVDYRTLSKPPDQLPMPTGSSPDGQGGAGAVPPTVDVGSIKVPSR